MQLTEKERDLLADTLIESLWQFPLEGTHRSVREMIVHKAIMPAVEGVLSDRAVPEPDAVHAVHEALVNSAPGWMIDREDGELFDMARAALFAVEEAKETNNET